jgi:hypothetical protein
MEASTEDHRVLYDPDSGLLSVDIDGTGEEQAAIVANLGSDLNLRHTLLHRVSTNKSLQRN